MSDAAELIWVTFGGKTFKCSRRTAAHLEWTDDRLQRQHPGSRIVVFQGSYNDDIAASAGTHDKDAVLDVQVVGLDWWPAQRFLRECGWAAWVRYPPSFGWHIHMVSLGYPGAVGIYVPGQVADYYEHRDGLASHAYDPTWHPDNIDRTIFDYPAWVASAEERAVADAVDRIIGEIHQNRERMNAAFAADRERDKRRFDALMAAITTLAADTEADADKIRARLRALKTELAELGTEDEPVEP